MNKDIKEYLNQKESEKLEFKREFNDNVREKLFKTICAFANDFSNKEKVAVFIIGLDDNGNLSGYKNSKKDEEKISNWINDWKVSPKPKITINTNVIGENEVILIEVKPSNLPTFYDKKMYIRLGSTTREADNFEIKKVLENFQNVSFDSSDCEMSSIDDIDEELFVVYQKSFVSKEIIKNNDRSFLEKLSAPIFANIITKHPTYGGILVCGKDPQRYIPEAKVLFLSIDSTDLLDRSKIGNEKVLMGDLSKILRGVEGLIEINIKQILIQETSTLKKKSDYPFLAIRELIFNAIMHRDYSISDMIRIYWFSDRIEIKSPGGLKFPASKENFPKRTVYRNTVISNAMKNLGKVERFGSGVAIAKNELKENKNPDIEFEFDDYYVKATIRKS